MIISTLQLFTVSSTVWFCDEESRGHVELGVEAGMVRLWSVSSEVKVRVVLIRRIAHGLSAGRLVQTIWLDSSDKTADGTLYIYQSPDRSMIAPSDQQCNSC